MTSTSTTPMSPSGGTVLIWLRALLLAGSGAAIFLLYHKLGVTDIGYDADRATSSVFVWLGERWLGDWRITRYAYSHYIPFISLFLVWRARGRLAAAARSPSVLGFLLVLLALFLHWAGMKAEQTRLSLLSLILLLWAIPYFLRGRATARVLFFPCAFLVLALPLNFFDSLTFPLRMVVAIVSTALLQGMGIPVVRSGSLLSVGSGAADDGAPGTMALLEPRFTLEVVDPSSGIFALGSLLAVALLVAHLTVRGGWRKSAFVIATPLIFVMGQVLRIVLIGPLFAVLGAAPSPVHIASASAAIQVGAWALLLWGLHRALHANPAARLRQLLTAHAPPPPRNW